MSTTRPLWSEAYLDQAERIFLRPAPCYSWHAIVTGAKVNCGSGVTLQIAAVEQNTFRGFHRIDKSCPGARNEFVRYFVEQQDTLLKSLARVHCRADLHQFSQDCCEALRDRLGNIRPSQLKAYNKIRKPLDLFLEHLVAMASELDDLRGRLVPYLHVPLDSQILAHCELFSDAELASHRLTRKSTYREITTANMYDSLQSMLSLKADVIAAKLQRPFHPIYFDLVWNERHCNSGGNLFETNP